MSRRLIFAVVVSASFSSVFTSCSEPAPAPETEVDAGAGPDAGTDPGTYADAGQQPQADAGDPAWDFTGSKQGQAVALFDLDGDGLDDKLVGAPYAQTEGGLGAVLVYRATEAGFSARPEKLLLGGDNLGFSIAPVGDLDGDGRDDVAIGALSGGALTGTVTLLAGGDGRPLRTLEAGTPMAKFGYAIAAGDLDADGARDLVVGAPFHTESAAAYQGGGVFVFFGPDFERTVSLAARVPTEAGLGWSLTVGDLGGDGVDDLVIGDNGDVLGFFGGAAFAPSLAAPNLRVKGTAAQFGRALAVLGDVDGDGTRDLAIGAPGARPGGGRDTGSVYLVKGGEATVDVDGAPPVTGLIVRLDGRGAFQRFGASLAATTDVDEDGRPELAVGAPLTDSDGLVLTGRVHLFKSTKLSAATVATDAVAFTGREASEGFGTSLATSSGKHLLIGAPRANADTGSVAMVDLSTGAPVPGGGSGGTGGEANEECHQ